jgi:hypothetical protein
MYSNGLIEQMVENPGMPTRNPSVAVFTVDSGDRKRRLADGQYVISQEPLNNIYINKGQPVMQGYFTRVALTEFNFPWNIPNVINGYNNTMQIIIPIQPLSIPVVVPQGFYTGTELAEAVTDAIATSIAFITATYPAVGAAYDIECTYNEDGTFTFENTIGGAAAATFGFFPSPNLSAPVQQSLMYIMGLGGFPGDVPSTARYITGVAPLIYTPYFDIVSSQLTKKQQVTDNSTSYLTGSNLLARIYLNKKDMNVKVDTDETQMLGCRPFTINREFIIPKQIYWDTKEFLNVVDLQLRDAWGGLLQEIPGFTEPADGATPATYVLGTSESNYQLTFQVSEV